MRASGWLVLFVLLAGLVALPAEIQAAKKKEPKAVPVKIMKASETKFKHAKIIQQKPVKKKRFFWFKKKAPKVVEPPVKIVPSEAMAKGTQLEPRKKGQLIPKPQVLERGEETKAVKKIDLKQKKTVVPSEKPAAPEVGKE